VKDWTQIPGAAGAEYSAPWAADFNALAQGYNYISARAWDAAGNVRELDDIFYIRKDTAAPVVTDLQSGATTWYRANPGAVFNVDFADDSIGVSTAAYEAWTAPGRTGTPVVASTTIFAGAPLASYTQNWGVSGSAWPLLAPGTNYISVTAWDDLGRSSVSVDVFYILKDTVPPSALASLSAAPAAGQAGEGDIVARWNAPGDDDLTGSASYYLIRYKTGSAFADQADFDSASVYVSTLAPRTGGLPEALTMSGFTAGATYYIAVEAVDKAGNAGPLSNLTSSYAGVDLTPPGAITDLAAAMADFQGQVALTWTAPGEGVKGVTDAGTAASYIVRYYAGLITSGNFSLPAVSSYTQSWQPLAYGQMENRVIDGLTPGATYSIAIKAVDEAGNTGAISNVPTSSATPAGAAAGMIVYGAGASNTPVYRNWTPDTWGAQTGSLATGATLRWSVLKSVPVVANAKIAGFLASDNSLKFLKWDGINSSWSDITPSPAPVPGGSATRRFDLAPESQTGRMLAVYYNNTTTAVSYAVWSSTAASWAAAPASLTLTGLTGAVNWVRLKAMPGTDRVLLMALDANSRLTAAVWTGTAWTSVQNLATTAAIATKECFDGDWESQTGNAVVLWGTTGNVTAYRIWRSAGSAWDGTAPAGPAVGNTTPNWIRVAADPLTNRLGATIMTVTPGWYVSIWRSTLGTEAWSVSPTADTGMSSNAGRITDAAWESQSGKFMAAAVDNVGTNDYQFDYLTWLNGTWTPASPSVTTPNTNTTFATDIRQLALLPDPNTNKITALGMDTSGNLKTTLWGGSSWAGAAASSNFLHISGVSDYTYEPAALAFDRQDPAPPTISDNQAGDDNWRNSRVSYNVDAGDTGGSHLASIQTKVYSQANGGGSVIQDWTDQVPGINADSYTADWQLTQTTFDLLPLGASYVGVRARDNAGNYSSNLLDAFFVKKDTTVPTITNNLAVDYDPAWHNVSQGSVYNVDFADTGGSQLRSLEYSASSGPNQTGIQTLGWTVISSGTVASPYQANWPVNFSLLGHGTNYISVRAIDNAFSTTTLVDAFKVLKDTQAPAAITGLAAAAGPVRGSVNLSWTAPGDDGDAVDNAVGYYIVKSATFQITTDALFNAASTFAQAWIPAAAGQPEARSVYGLETGITYYFAVKTADKAANISALSNQAASLAQQANLYINEVYAAGSAAEDWIELYNNTSSTFNLTGWKLVYDQGSIAQPGLETTLWTGASVDRSSVNATFLIGTLTNLNSAQSYHVILKDPAGNVADRVQWPFTSAGTSFARITDGNASYFEVDPTPTRNYANSVATDPVKINEVAYGTPDAQFIELHNTGTSTPTLAGYSLRNSNGVKFPFTRKLYAGGYTALNYYSVSDAAGTYAGAFGAQGLKAAGDFLALENAAGQTVDLVTWQSDGNYTRYDYRASTVSYSNAAPANTAYSIGRPADGTGVGVDSGDFPELPLRSIASGNNNAGTGGVNTLAYPANGQVLPRKALLALSLGGVSTSGPADNLLLLRTGGAADARSPHIYRLQDLGFDLALSVTAQTTAQTWLTLADQDGYYLVDGSSYTLVLNSDSASASAPQQVRTGLLYDASQHAASAADTSAPRMNEGVIDDVLKVQIANNSPSGLNSIEFATAAVCLLNADLVPLTSIQAGALIERIAIFRDNAAGIAGAYESAIDADEIASLDKALFALDGQGCQALAAASPDGAAASVAAYSTATYFVTVEVSTYGASESTNTFRVRLDPAGLILRDGPSDQAQEISGAAPVTTASSTVITPAKPPAGTTWPYDAGPEAGVETAVGIYENYGNILATVTYYSPGIDGAIRAFNYTGGNPKWVFYTAPLSPIRSAPWVEEEGGGVYIYFANDNGDLYKIRDNGDYVTEAWPSKRNLGAGVQIRSGVVQSGNKLYFGTSDNKIYCLNKADGLNCAGWTFDGVINSPVAGTISIDEYTPGVNSGWVGLQNWKMVQFRSTDGVVTSEFQTGGPIESSPYFDSGWGGANNNLYFTSRDGKLYSRTSSNLTTLPGNWGDFTTSPLSPIYSTPWLITLDKKYVFFGDDSGALYKVDASSGAPDGLIWKFQARGSIRSMPVVWGGYAYFGTMEGYVYAVDANTGALREGWPVAVGGAVKGEPVLDTDNYTLVIGASDGKTYMISIGP
ncbi:MAG TPA: hypothetical protein DCZ92_09180, partial [Elusimicrobia bacterium]|nr:hypothetical protein [Elusimicrobiota bacterium]